MVTLKTDTKVASDFSLSESLPDAHGEIVHELGLEGRDTIMSFASS